MKTWDVIIAGGGPVGLVTAIAARRHGLSALVLESSPSLPIKACGEGLMPRAVAALEELGVPLDGAREFRGIRFLDGDTIAQASFQGRRGRALGREALMQRLERRACELGVVLYTGHTLRDFAYAGGTVRAQVSSHTGGPLDCTGRLLVGADGLRSPTRRRLGYELPPRQPPRFGSQCHYQCAPWSDWVEVYWHARAEAYVTPLGPDRVGVAVLSHGRAPAPAQWAELFPELTRRLGAAPAGRLRGAGPLEQRVRGVLAPGVALVGDAAGYLDALSGEGLALGFGSALALMRRFAGGELWRYPRDHRRITASYYRMTRLLLAFARRPRCRAFAIRFLSRNPRVFSALLSASAEGDVASAASPPALPARAAASTRNN
jgi:flavin-dependent dehydrogenase